MRGLQECCVRFQEGTWAWERGVPQRNGRQPTLVLGLGLRAGLVGTWLLLEVPKTPMAHAHLSCCPFPVI